MLYVKTGRRRRTNTHHADPACPYLTGKGRDGHVRAITEDAARARLSHPCPECGGPNMTYPAKPQRHEDAPCKSHGKVGCAACRRGIPAVDPKRIKAAIAQAMEVPIPSPGAHTMPATPPPPASRPASLTTAMQTATWPTEPAQEAPNHGHARSGQAKALLTGLPDGAARLLNLEGVKARVLDAILKRPGIGSKALCEAAECTGGPLSLATVHLHQQGWIRIELRPDQGKMVRSHHAERAAIADSVLAALAGARTAADVIRGD